MAKYLDWGGLTTFWTKIKNWVKDYVKFTEESSGVRQITIGELTLTPIQSVTAGVGLNTTSDNTSTDGGVIGIGSGQARSGTIYLSTTGVTANSYGPSTNATPAAGATFNVPYLTVDKYGRVTAASTKTVTIPAAPTSFNITVTDDILDGTGGANSVGYAPWSSSNKAAGRLYSGTTNPTNDTRLNYDGYFYAKKLYSEGNEVAPLSSPALTGTPTAPTATAGTDTTQIATTAFVQTAITFVEVDGVKGSTINRTGMCLTQANTAAKTVTITGLSLEGDDNQHLDIIKEGTQITVFFQKGNTADTPTLNVNSAGAEYIYYKNRKITTGAEKTLLKGTCTFVYISTEVIEKGWHLIGDTVTTVDYDTTNKKITQTVNGTTTDVVTAATLLSDANGVTLTGTQTLTNKTLTSPDLTGTPTAPTATAGTNTTQIATTAFVANAVSNGVGAISVSDDILDGSITNNAILYSPYASKGAGHLYTGTTNPDSTNRLNYDGYFYATKLYSGGSEVLTSHQTIKQDGITGATVNRYGTCSTGASTATKEVSITSGTFSLEAGARVTVNFTNANTASSPKLKVGSTTAKDIKHNGTAIGSGETKDLLNGVCDFIYDGSYWNLISIDSKRVKVNKNPAVDNPNSDVYLMISTQDQAEEIEAGIYTTLKFNPSSGNLQATKFNNYTLGAACAKGVVTSISADSDNLPTVTAIKTYINTQLTDAAMFQGVLKAGTSLTSLPSTGYKKGQYWIVGTASVEDTSTTPSTWSPTYAGQVCEVGDTIFCVKDYASGTASNDDFTIIQTNIEIITDAEINGLT